MKHSTFMNIAKAVAQESKCVGLQVGAVLVRDGHVLSTGYNGTPKGMPNCDEVVGISINRCDHYEWSKKQEVHAEMNAIIHCLVSTQGSIAYVTDSPCFNCTKHLIASGVKEIYYEKLYHHYLTDMKEEWEEVLDFCTEARVYLRQLSGNAYFTMAGG